MEEKLVSREKQESKLFALISGIFSYLLLIQSLYTLNTLIAENHDISNIALQMLDLTYLVVYTVALLVGKSRVPFAVLAGYSFAFCIANTEFKYIGMQSAFTTVCNILNYISLMLLLAYCIMACAEKQRKISPSAMRAMCLVVIIVHALYYLLTIANSFAVKIKYSESMFSNFSLIYLESIFISLLLCGRTAFLCLWMSPYNKKEDVVYDREKQLGFVRMYEHVIYLLFTCGIWELIWIFRTTKALNEFRDEFDKERDPLTCVLLSMFIPFYYLYWLYKTCKRIEEKAQEQGDYCSLAVLCVVLSFIIGIVPPILVQNKLNEIAKKIYAAENEQTNEAGKDGADAQDNQSAVGE